MLPRARQQPLRINQRDRRTAQLVDTVVSNNRRECPSSFEPSESRRGFDKGVGGRKQFLVVGQRGCRLVASRSPDEQINHNTGIDDDHVADALSRTSSMRRSTSTSARTPSPRTSAIQSRTAGRASSRFNISSKRSLIDMPRSWARLFKAACSSSDTLLTCTFTMTPKIACFSHAHGSVLCPRGSSSHHSIWR